MKLSFILTALIIALLPASSGQAHDLSHEDDDHPHYDWSVRPPEQVLFNKDQVEEIFQLAQTPSPRLGATRGGASSNHLSMPLTARPFSMFAGRVKLHWDDRFLYVESNGLPAHNMMVGITAWQQQVPLPQPYFGDNAWTIPLHPSPSSNPLSIKGRFLRGAIALAANGIPIFNPQNNRGEISQEIGELDQWGGHCGRADDYHYHAAPLHLQAVVGKGQPIAYALDGYAIFGLTEPDGSQPTGLDAFDGHTTPALGYHYHASQRYPYVNGGFHGQVTERDGQVDPQPRAQSVREALPPLRGATITGFTASPDGKNNSLRYTQDGRTGAVNYSEVINGVWKFQYVSADGTKTEQTYRGGNEQGVGVTREPEIAQGRAATASDHVRDTNVRAYRTNANRTSSSFVLRSKAVTDGGDLPKQFTGDGNGTSPPLEWVGAPAATRSFALSMHHIDREGETKWYWTLYNIPANIHTLPENVKGVGTAGNNSVNGDLGYAPPHSKGPGAKTYTISLYALSAPLLINIPPSQVSREVMLKAMQGKVLAISELHVVYTRGGEPGAQQSPSEKPPPSDRPPPS